MGSLDKLENTLDEVFTKKIPLQLPEDARKAIATSMWWIALIIGVLQLWSAYQVWHWGHQVVAFVDALYSYVGQTSSLHFTYYLTLIVLAIVGVLTLLATPSLKNMKKEGWNILFYAVLFEALAAVIRLFVPEGLGGGFGNFVMSALCAGVGAFVLFQIRSYFIMTHRPAHTMPVPPAKAEKTDAAVKEDEGEKTAKPKAEKSHGTSKK